MLAGRHALERFTPDPDQATENVPPLGPFPSDRLRRERSGQGIRPRRLEVLTTPTRSGEPLDKDSGGVHVTSSGWCRDAADEPMTESS